MDTTQLSDVQLAYIAGMIDGEGSLECQRQFGRGSRTPRYVLRLAFVMSTEEPLRTIGQWLGYEPKCYPPASDRHMPRWRMSLPKGIAEPLLRRCLPFLILKRDQAELILTIEQIRSAHSPPRSIRPGPDRRMPAEAVGQMEEMHQRLRALKSGKRPAQLTI